MQVNALFKKFAPAPAPTKTATKTVKKSAPVKKTVAPPKAKPAPVKKVAAKKKVAPRKAAPTKVAKGDALAKWYGTYDDAFPETESFVRSRRVRSLAVLGVQGMPFVFVFVSVFVGSDRKFRDARLKGTRPREEPPDTIRYEGTNPRTESKRVWVRVRYRVDVVCGDEDVGCFVVDLGVQRGARATTGTSAIVR